MQGVQTQDGYAVAALTNVDIIVVAGCAAVAILTAVCGMLIKKKNA